MGPKYPDITVNLYNTGGNAFAVLGAVSKALRRAGRAGEAKEYQEEATKGNYDHLLRTNMKWVNIE